MPLFCRSATVRLSVLIALASAMPAAAQEASEKNLPLSSDIGEPTPTTGPITISGNVSVVSDYRFRGISFSGGDPALQGGFDIVHESGAYVGTWGSSLDSAGGFGELELDLYAGYSAEVADGITVDGGLLYYVYPTEDTGADTDYFEPYASVSGTLGPVGAKMGVAYAWEQDSIGGEDNLYIYTDLSSGIPNTPFTVTAHLGYTDGVFSVDEDDTSWDYSIGASATVLGGLTAGIAYVGVEDGGVSPVFRKDFTDDTVVFSIGYEF